MYTIKRAAERARGPVASVRAWGRRYGVVAPARTGSGYRVYDDAAVERLRAMRALIADGWSASAAAGAVIAGDVPRRSSSAVLASGEQASGALAYRLLDGARRIDAAAVDRVLDQMFLSASFERGVVNGPACQTVRSLVHARHLVAPAGTSSLQ